MHKQETCRAGDWVALTGYGDLPDRIALLRELVQVPGSMAQRRKEASFVLVQEAALSDSLHLYYRCDVSVPYRASP